MRFLLSVRTLALCAAPLLMLSTSAGAAIIGPATSVPVSDPTSLVDASTPGITYYTQPGTALLTNGFDLRDLFGGSFGTNNWEHNDALFTDGLPRGTVSSVTISLPAPILLNGYTLYLQDDGTNGNRSASEFLLYAGSTLLDDVQILDHTGTQSYTSQYGTSFIQITDSLIGAPASATYTLSFVQNQDAGPSSGVRASEFTTAVPEPTSIALLAIGSISLLPRRRRLA